MKKLLMFCIVALMSLTALMAQKPSELLEHTSADSTYKIYIWDGVPGHSIRLIQVKNLIGTANPTEFRILDGALVTTPELNMSVGLTGNIQTQINGKISKSDTVSGTGYVETQFRSDTAKAAIRAEIAAIDPAETSMVYPTAGIALSTGTAWGTSIVNNSSSWNTAYGWGNHASAGYAPLLNPNFSGTVRLNTVDTLATRAYARNYAGTGDPINYPSAGIAVSTGSAWDTPIVNNSANWNTAYGWGNHAGLYDPLNTASGLFSTHNSTYNHANIANGQTAYGWGNHADAGYVTGTPWTAMGYVTGTPWTSVGYYVGTASTIRELLSSTLPGLTYTSATGVISATSGYAIPTTASFGAKIDSTWFNDRSRTNHDSTLAAAVEAPTRAEFLDSISDLRALITTMQAQIVALLSNGDFVTSINVASLSGDTVITTDGGTLQIMADVEPNTAVDTTTTGTLIEETGTATLEGTPLILTALTNGTVRVRFTANDGSGVYGEQRFTFSNQVDAATDNFEAYSAAALVGQGNWIAGLNTISVVDVAGNKKINPGTSEDHCAAVYNQTFANNQYAQIVRGTETSGYIGVGVRLSGSGATLNGYTLSSNATTCTLGKYTNGVWSLLAEGAQAVTTNDVLKLTVVGNELSCYLNGSLITAISTDGKVTDTSYTTGKVGITGYGSWAQRADSWEGGSL